MTEVNIRPGKIEDLPHVLMLIKELAEYEHALHEVTNTVDTLARDGFGDNPVFGFFVAENKNEIVGLSLYYYRYSTWKGKRLYLEDIVVTEAARGKGVGKLLFDCTMQRTIDDNCNGMNWQALDWNEPAFNFYRKYNAKIDREWVNCSLESAEIKKLINDKQKD